MLPVLSSWISVEVLGRIRDFALVISSVSSAFCAVPCCAPMVLPSKLSLAVKESTSAARTRKQLVVS